MKTRRRHHNLLTNTMSVAVRRSQIEATEKLLKKQERERQERSLVDRQLLHTLPLVHEANGISQEVRVDFNASSNPLAAESFRSSFVAH